MGLFKKLFRRKKNVERDGGASKVPTKESKSGKYEVVNNNQRRPLRKLEAPNPAPGEQQEVPRSSSYEDARGQGRVGVFGAVDRSPSGQSKSEHVRVLAPRNILNGPAAGEDRASGKFPASSRYDENLNQSGSHGSSASPRLSQQHLQNFNTQNSMGPPAKQGGNFPMYTMSDMPRAQVDAMDDMNRSDASSSSFNLSTDAEDSEYETLRRRGVLPIARPSRKNAGDSSVLSAISGPSMNTAESDLFPALQTSADSLNTGSISDQEGRSPPKKQEIHRHPYLTRPIEDGVRSSHENKSSPSNSAKQISVMEDETDDDLRAWGVSPTSASLRREPVSGKSMNSDKRFTFKSQASPPLQNDDGFTPRSSGPVDPPTSTTSRSTAGRNFTSPKSRTSDHSGFSQDSDFDGFVDFNAFGNNAFAPFSNREKKGLTEWKEEKKTADPSQERKLEEPPDGLSSRNENKKPLQSFGDQTHKEASRDAPVKNYEPPRDAPVKNYAQSSPGGLDSSLAELLAQAKEKQRRSSSRVRSSRASSSSVNSAPAMTAAYLRQHHNLGKYTSSRSGEPDGAASVSDIISSLEASDQSRLRTGSRASYGHRSVGESGPVSTSRSIKERLREKIRLERELGAGGKGDEGSSSDNSDNEASESWLFDEVTGALGPRGVAADLESLSGRSNRSRESRGNKSHKSHRSRSRRHRQSGSRRNPSSGESVDSRGSKTSRASRYSHRSTKSFLSQMSEQSRSVANDLLRLEMQLAMVGKSEDHDDGPARVGASSQASGAGGGVTSSRPFWNGSSNGRHSIGSQARSPSNGGQHSAISHATRRTKINIVAPPGKLGIILANKADAKGTVVSGVRSSSVLADKVTPGDRIVAIDGEDVSRMTVSEITTIMSRKADYERNLTVLTLPKQLEQPVQHPSFSPNHSAGMRPSIQNSLSPPDPFESNSIPQFRH